MHLPVTVEWALHSCVALAMLPPGSRIPARYLAEYHGLKPAYLAKALHRLAAVGLLSSKEGRHGGLALAKPASDITVLDIIDALSDDTSFFHCTEIRQEGPCVGRKSSYKKACPIARTMRRADEAWRDVLKACTLSELIGQVSAESDPTVIEKTNAWLETNNAIRYS